MIRIPRICVVLPPLLVMAAGVAYAQYPIMNRIADKVIQKYQTSNCQQLWQEKMQKEGKPEPEGEQRALKLLHEDPEMRTAFINKIAPSVLNKMFECHMIP